jgi:hypothetical protein
MPIRGDRGASPPPPPENERTEIETMLHRLEELRRKASNSDLRSAYETATGSLDGVVYRLAMLRALDPPKPVRRPAEALVSVPPLGSARRERRTAGYVAICPERARHRALDVDAAARAVRAGGWTGANKPARTWPAPVRQLCGLPQW